MAINQAVLNSLIQRYAQNDPLLYDILSRMASDIQTVTNIVLPIQTTVDALSADEPVPGQIPTIIYELLPTSVRFTWTAPDVNARTYEIRKGNDWETAEFILRTPSTIADINPIPTGTHRYLFKALNSDNEEGPEASIDVVVPVMGTTTINVTTIDNAVLLVWTPVTSVFQITHYKFSKKRGSDPYVFVGNVTGTFVSTFETASDTYTYKIEPVDFGGNVGPESTVQKFVNKPPDFELLTEFTSALTGTRVNVGYFEDGGIPKLVAPIDDDETYEDHFLLGAQSGKPWDTPQEQVDNGYPLYIQPAASAGYYEEVFDLGTEIQNVVVNISFALETITGTVTVLVTMSGSLDNVLFENAQSGTSAFFSAVRYLKIRIDFTAAADLSLVQLSNLHGTVDVKREVDSGEAIANKDEFNGTFVLFNKSFKDIDSVTATAESTEPLEVHVRFEDVPNPTGFFAYVIDTAGQRITRQFFWKARGIV